MKEIAPKVYHIPLMPRNSINVYLAEGFLFDAGIKSSKKKLIRKLGNTSLHTHVLTHAHADHQGSSSAVCQHFNIPLWCSEQEKAFAESGDVTRQYPDPNHLISRLQRRFWSGEGHPVSKTLKEGDKLGNFTVIETPGHSQGHLSFFRENDGLLIVGDVATNMNLLTTFAGLHEPPAIFTLDKETNRNSLRKLAALKPKILCFGHGPVLVNDGKFERFVAKL
ncbi:MAG: MBL fold metallo-hydrolase [Bacteroidetes bacterium]|nr:MBL fold metallo-hydrolase [Bacteroidota bacterium]